MLNLDGSYQFIGASELFVRSRRRWCFYLLDYSELLVLFSAERYDLGIKAKQVSTPTGAEGFLIDL